ncbi:MAG: tyrosine--tRNA ligase [Methanobacteriaceae archaeon]|uniref:Tyrosine--tRNA ligase n=1 Tax=Methanothermobacter tenebrarum TaxID=680118 RepID=A0A328PD49_9EURY|nr:tyrosine--tRNA ligase [Methanobacteriaceae archaeon]RAO79780.1 tyrosine--tRNA ligase [Methanothermobacter tenebrarum]
MVIKVDIEEKIKIAKKGTIELITEEELREKLQKRKPVAYIGYEPSGKIHVGHAITVMKLLDLQRIGFKVKVLLADYHAHLNGKGPMEKIEEMAEYNKRCFKALGLSDDTEFILGSSFQTKEEYTHKLYELSLITTLARAKRSMAQITREAENPKVAEVIYPLMQVIDMIFLEVDLALGGMEQRKIHMLARENLPRLGYNAPVCMHTPLLHGTDGGEKMSSSKGNFIAVDDPPEVIREKIKKSYCPMKEIKGNPIIEMAEYLILPMYDRMLIKRPEKFGGDLELGREELIKAYSSGELHPLDLKNAVSEYLIEIFEPAREYLE